MLSRVLLALVLPLTVWAYGVNIVMIARADKVITDKLICLTIIPKIEYKKRVSLLQ